MAGFGRLRREGDAKPISEINVTPLVDVMLVLVVIFIVTAPLLGGSIRLDLPKTDAAQPAAPMHAVTLVLDRAGNALLDDKPVDAGQLAHALVEAARADPDTEVQLRADSAVPYGRVVEIMGVAQKAGLNRIGFVAEPENPRR